MINKLKAALAALETSQQFVEASSNAKLHPGWGSQLDEAEAAIFDLRSVIAVMEAGEPVAIHTTDGRINIVQHIERNQPVPPAG